MTLNVPLTTQQLRDIRAQERRIHWGRDFSGASGYADDALIEELVEASHRRVPIEPTNEI